MSVLFLPPSAGAASVPDATELVSGKIRIATSAEATTGTNDLTAMTPLKVKSVVDAAVVGGVTYQGTFDTSSPVDLSNAEKGDLYIISVAGSYQGQTWAVGDHLLVNEDMGGTISPSKIDKVDNTDSVTSVAGKTGAVTLVAGDVSGLAAVATSGAYSDLSGTPTLATVATTGAYSDLSGTPTLGTAAAEDVGTAASNVVQLDGSARLPAVDGSQLLNLPSGASTLGALTDVDVTGAVNTNVLKYNSTSGDWEDGAVAYSEVTGTPALATVATTGAYSDLSGTPTLATVATTGAYSDLSGTPTLGTAAAEDVGTSAGNVVQLDGSARLPAVDGSQLLNLPPSATFDVIAVTGTTTLSSSLDDGHYLVTVDGAHTVTIPAYSADANIVFSFRHINTGAGDATIYYNTGQSQLFEYDTNTGQFSLPLSDSGAMRTFALRWTASAASSQYWYELQPSSLNSLPDVSYTAGAGIDNYVLTYDHSTSTWGAAPSAGGGGASLPTVTTTATSYTVPARTTELAVTVLVNNGASAVTITLPSIASGDIGFTIDVKVLGTGSVTIDAGSNFIDDGASTSISLNTQYDSRTLQAGSTTDWYII